MMRLIPQRMKLFSSTLSVAGPGLSGAAWFVCLLSLDIGGTGVRAEEVGPPPPGREFRAAWVATVANIDWPSRPGLSSRQQQQELISLLDRAAQLNLNAIVFQVRPHCDALYASPLEPWSEYLTGAMGQAPQPYYDPLEMAVREAHLRGLELHAWFNPYRASHPSGHSELAADHISRLKPHVVREYGKYLWLDPGEPEAAEHSLAVILDVVRRYDVDGVHFDDYFYPYPIKDEQDQPIPFPDDRSWQQAQAAGETLSRDDWRRQNVDRFIARAYREIKKEKPWVKFGVSPFGIWRPGHPEGIHGFDAYASLYADSRKWLAEGSLDYFTPQLYWKIGSSGQSYPVLLKWWRRQNKLERHLWPGNFTSRVANPDSGDWPVDEIIHQIEVTRQQPGASGNVHFSMKALLEDRGGMAEALATGPYQKPALVPASTWLGNQSPATPEARLHDTKLYLRMPNNCAPWLWVVQTQSTDGWQTTIVPGHVGAYDLALKPGGHLPLQVAVTAVNRLALASPVKLLGPEGQ
jgi:uncharacterized lipoprotein YddW (UPF0748 family)